MPVRQECLYDMTDVWSKIQAVVSLYSINVLLPLQLIVIANIIYLIKKIWQNTDVYTCIDGDISTDYNTLFNHFKATYFEIFWMTLICEKFTYKYI